MSSDPVAEQPFESAVLRAVPYLAVGLVGAGMLLAVPSEVDTFVMSVVHLSVVVALGLAAAISLAPLAAAQWFAARPWPAARKRLAGWVALVVIVTGVIGLVTLASSAALRFQPSLQFLQLLSALDIAWAAGAVVIGGRALWGSRVAAAAGVVVGVVCVASIWNYLRVVGFGEDGGWVVDGGRLLTLVIPADMVAAIFAGAVLVIGSARPRPQPTVQASAQS